MKIYKPMDLLIFLKLEVNMNKNVWPYSKFLWFNKAVRYQNQSMFVEKFCKTGIFDFFQLLKSDYKWYSYNEVASALDMTPNNMSFIRHIKLISAIPTALITTLNSNSHESFYASFDFK